MEGGLQESGEARIILCLEDWDNKSPDYILLIKTKWILWGEAVNFRTTEFELMAEHLSG